jgi:hypothetical protein
MKSMSKWALGAGIVCVILGAFLPTLIDFLPLDFWSSINDLLLTRTRTQHTFLRVVPTTDAPATAEYVLTGTGIFLLAFGFYLKAKK